MKNMDKSEMLNEINRQHIEEGNNELDFSHIKGIVLYDISEEEGKNHRRI